MLTLIMAVNGSRFDYFRMNAKYRTYVRNILFH